MEEIKQMAPEEKYYSTERVKRGLWCFSFVYVIAWVNVVWFQKCLHQGSNLYEYLRWVPLWESFCQFCECSAMKDS